MSYAATVGTPRVALVTLGCARNEVDSEELAGRMSQAGFALVDDAETADAVVVNTCGFIDAAKRESIDVLLSAAGPNAAGAQRTVVAVGCMAERYGVELAAELPEADAVLGFDAYPDIADRRREVMDGATIASHVPRDRRTLLPLAPVERRAGADAHVPGVGPGWIRRRMTTGPVASLKIASDSSHRCTASSVSSSLAVIIASWRSPHPSPNRWPDSRANWSSLVACLRACCCSPRVASTVARSAAA